jgi:hypothetical protein
MTRALPPTIALVDQTRTIPTADLAQVAGALGEQIAVDVEPIWHTRANVIATQTPGPFQWAVNLRTSLDYAGALGYHTDNNHTPVAYVDIDEGDWPSIVSHEVLEMLVDPWGSRTHSARIPMGIDHQQVGLPHESTYVHYLVEICDPCERTSYPVQGVQLSDFLHPSYYRTNPTMNLAYSHAGGVTQPRQVAEGGYVSFARHDGEWFQAHCRHGQLVLRDIGRFDRQKFGSIREFTDHHAREARSSWS